MVTLRSNIGSLFFGALILVGALVGSSKEGYGFPNYLTELNSRYSSSYSCNVCHTQPTGGPRNSYGQAYAAAGHSLAAIEPQDSDGDGFTNLQELQAGTLPGNPTSKPVVQDTTPPVVTSFSVPSTSNSLTVPITALTATDNVGVTGYAVSESSSVPVSGWSASVPSSYTFSSAGTKTLYAWARDAAGNVSAPKSAQVTITLNPRDRKSVV